MRYIPTNQLKPDMILGEDIFDASGRLLLGEDTILTAERIAYLEFLDVTGVYITDDLSRDIYVKNVVQPEIRRQAVATVHESFGLASNMDRRDEELASNEIKIRTYVESIVNEVLDNEHVMYNLIALKTHDDYTYFHSVNVAILAGIIGAKCGLMADELDDLVTAGFLHDIGKIFIAPDLINAPRRLTEEERIKMMDHPRLGYEFLVENYDFSDRVNRAVLEHHEWFNGGGYPYHRIGKELQTNSKILKAADVYDAMTSKRPYHPPFLPAEVMEYIWGRNAMEFSPSIVEVMTRELCIYPVGCEIELSDGRRAIVMENHVGYIQRPTIKLLDTGDVLNLKTDRSTLNLTIKKLLI